METHEHLIIPPDIMYMHKHDHRSHSPVKSQWIISESEERACCILAMRHDWRDKEKHNVRWGLHIIAQRPEYLGSAAQTATNPCQPLFIAKFVDGNYNKKWHGYPANPSENTKQDTPPTNVLNEWMTMGFLRPQTIRKLVKGSPCKL